MKYTTVTVTKIRKSLISVDVELIQVRGIVVQSSTKLCFITSSIADVQDFLASLPSRECQRYGSSSGFSRSIRAAMYGSVVFTSRWSDGRIGLSSWKGYRTASLLCDALALCLGVRAACKRVRAINDTRGDIQ
jgi:hypothetical protein